VKKLSEGQEWLLKLERERFNVAHRVERAEVVFVPTPVKCRRKHISENRDKLFFHAGRYSAGARDQVAMDANAWIEKNL
jgi:hypothetical protein